jgi:rod shape determining protein RodA
MKRLTVWQKLSRLHWVMLTLMLFMATAGIFFIFSATHSTESPVLARAAYQQVTWLGIGLGVFLFCALIEYETVVRYGWIIFAGMLLVLVYVLFFGRVVNNSRSWIGVGGFGVQPAEFTKIALICGLAWFLVRQQDHIGKFWMILAVAGIALVPFGLILLQPDFGSAAVLAPITFFILWAAGGRKRYLVIPVVGVVIAALSCYWIVYRANWDGTLGDVGRATSDGVLMAIHLKGKPEETEATAVAATALPARPSADELASGAASKPVVLLKTYQLNRIRTFFKPDLDPLGAGWTIRQSLIAVGSGGLKGKGYLKGDQNIYGFLPKDIAYNDFIFSVIAEEWGFAGGTLLIICQGTMILCILRIGSRAKDLSGTVLCAGFAGLWFTHFFINIGMTIKVVPITGIPLPLTSYGGTFLVSCMAGLGLVQSVWIHRRDY